MTKDNSTIKTNMAHNTTEPLILDAATEKQVAQHITVALNEHAQHLNARQLKRLSDARTFAVAKLNPHTIQVSGGVLHWLGHGLSQHRAMSTAMVAGLMLFTFVIAQQIDFYDHLENSDAFLLASELPPEAFADKGFDTWLDAKVRF